MDLNYYTLALFFDITRAFDCVDPSYLVKKLYALGIRGNINQRISSFLTDRSIRVKVKNCFSEKKKVKYGVPQGGVLSPLLFALFVNDLESFLISPESSAKLTLYADDATVAISASSLDELARTSNDILSKFSEWCKSNHLVVNATKTHYMIFYRKREVPDLNLTLDGNRIERVEQCRFLGLYLDSQLKWTAHVDFVAGKLNSAYYAIVNLKSFMDTKNLLNIYYALA